MSADGPVKLPTGPWLSLFSRYRLGSFRGVEVVQGSLHPHLGPRDEEVEAALEAWEGEVHVTETPRGIEIVLVRSVGEPERTRWGLHGLLLALTAFTTLMAGALLEGVDPLDTRFVRGLGAWWPVPTGIDAAELLVGLPFSLTLMGILLAHELGHYLTARRHRVRATLPFFIPFPAYWSVVGTLGAFIRIRSPLVNRKLLFDVGAAGPFASFVLSVPLFLWGLAGSRAVPGGGDAWTPFLVRFAGEPLRIGTGVLSAFLALLLRPEVGQGATILLNPVAFAAWLGLFVTCLNLLPFGQLDGGHVLYALSPPLQRWAGALFLLLLVPLGLVWWGWWVWGVAAYVLSRGRLSHPPVLQPDVPLGRGRRILALAAIGIFFLTFVPVPINLEFP